MPIYVYLYIFILFIRTFRMQLLHPACWIDIHVFRWRSHTNMNYVFRSVTLYMIWIRIYSRWMYSQNRMNMNRIPYFFPRSAYSTCRCFTLRAARISRSVEYSDTHMCAYVYIYITYKCIDVCISIYKHLPYEVVSHFEQRAKVA